MNPRQNTVVVKGYTELVRAFARTDVEVEAGLRKTLHDVGEVVRVDAAARLAPYNARSARGLRTVVFQRGVDVRQTIQKTTGTRPDFGAFQMKRILLPALDTKRAQTEFAFEKLLDEVVVANFGF